MTTAIAVPAVEQLETALAAAVAAEDWDLVDALSADMEALEDGADPADLARLDEVAALIEQGASEFDACAAVYGMPAAERLQRQEAIRVLRQQYTGRSFDDLARQSYRDHVEDAWLAAEEACRGHLVNRTGRTAHVDSLSLFTGPLARAQKYASDELIEWWETNGRTTFDEWREQLLTGTCTAATRFRGSGRALERRGHETALPKTSIPRKDTPAMTAAMDTAPRVLVIDEDRYDGREHGEVILDNVRHFVSRFVAFPTPATLDMVTLWIAHTHVIDGNGRLAFDATPRLAFISDEPASGKTRAMELVIELSRNGLILVDPTHPSFAEEMHDNQRSLGFDEVDMLFGNTGRAKGTLNSLLNNGYRRKSATWTRKGQDEMSTFGPVVMAGLAKRWRASDALKPLRSRTLQVTMIKGGTQVESYRPRSHDNLAAKLRKVLSTWAGRHAPLIVEDWPSLPDGVDDRDAEIWEPLFMVANAAGGHWPASVRAACEEFVLGNQDNAPEELPLSQQLLADLRAVFGPERKMSTVRIIQGLYAIPGAPWRQLWPDETTAPRELSALLGDEVQPIKVREGERSLRGYDRLHAADGRRSLEELWADVPDRPEPKVPGVPDVPDED
jgi:hypothetical protein